MITKSEQVYICSKGSDMAVEAILLHANDTLTLWDNGNSTEHKTIGDAEKQLCDKYHEVMLDRKVDSIITKLEKVIQ